MIEAVAARVVEKLIAFDRNAELSRADNRSNVSV